MKRVLIITYYWPPSGGAGVQRWLKFVKYLRESGWEPVIYTPENPESPDIDPSLEKEIPADLTIIKRPIWEPYLFYKRFLGQKKDERIQAAFLSEKKKNPIAEKISVWIRGNIFIPDARKYFIKPSVKFLLSFLNDHPQDLIISTGPPHSMHRIALVLSQKTGIPWLADFRDPWTGIDFYKDLRLTKLADRKHRRMELEVLRKADEVTVVSPSMVDEFRKIVDRRYEVVTNGFDPEDLVSGNPVVPDPKFSLAHIGTLSPARNPDVLWDVLKDLTLGDESFRTDCQINLVGKVDHLVMDSIERSGLKQYVIQENYLPHEEVLKVQQRSQALLLLINNTPNAKGILTGKLFEYIASGRPVICIGPVDGDAAKILQETGAGKVSGFHDREGLKENIRGYYNLFKQGKLFVEGKDTERFSRKNLTIKMAELMDRAVLKKKSTDHRNMITH
jgi:glycosyltransferase involved in cell wall biosynthesis